MWQKIGQAASNGQCDNLTRMLSVSPNVHFSRVVRNHLTAVCETVDQQRHVEFQQISCLGKAWVKLGLALLELYLPNVPLDPIAAQQCTFKLWKDREAEVLAQIKLHQSAEQLTTGADDNPLLRMLRGRLNQIRLKLQESGDMLLSRDVDVEGLHALFGEITPFVTQVLHSTKFNELLQDLEATHQGSASRALMVQATISGFVTRMKSGYSHFSDIIQPILEALSFVKFGLHFLGHAALCNSTNSRLSDRIRVLVKFPTVAAIEDIKTDMSNPISSPHILLALTATAYDFCLGDFLPGTLRHLDDTYYKIAELWVADLHDQERQAQDSQSLYRHKQNDHISDIDIDEREFSAMFPTYEDTMDGEKQEAQDPSPSIENRNASPILPRLSRDDKERVYRIHLWIMTRNHTGNSLELLDDEYQKLRTMSIRNILASNMTQLPHSLDVASVPYQVLLLSKGMVQLNSDSLMQRLGYSFYHSPNIPEVRKALSLVRTIQQRLLQLVKDWPDQMVLHHLMTRCGIVLQLSIRSPIAKVLTTLEQLLLQTEDWEMYSNKENTLKPQQAALSELIVSWRRLELSSWSHLLESQYSSFCSGTADWWFRLYELTIRGTLAAAGGDSPLDVYFAEMISLVEQFISGSPLGQFAARLELLNSFGLYSKILSDVRSKPESDALARGGRILQSLHGLFNQFSNSVSGFLAEKRSALENELLDYIKSASWKDINVYALKQSAQRTHHHLFKCARKFRDLLREPVAPIFLSKTTDLTISQSLLSDCSRPVFTCLANTSAVTYPDDLSTKDMPIYMVNLSGTLMRFEHLLKSHGEPLVNSVCFETVDSLAGRISETVAILSSETDAAGDNKQMHKTLMMRKRKAWIDLLQELKRAGLSSRLKPEVLDRHQDKVWLLDRPSLTGRQSSAFHSAMLKAEGYFRRMLHFLPELRHSLSSYQGDLTIRELQRAVTFVESSFALALDTRARLVS